MRIIRIQIDVHVIERIFKTGHRARGGRAVDEGLPNDAMLIQAQLTEPQHGHGDTMLSLYFQCGGDGFEDRSPKLRPNGRNL